MIHKTTIFTSCRPLTAQERLDIWAERYAAHARRFATTPESTPDVKVSTVLHTGAPCTRLGVLSGLFGGRSHECKEK